MGDAINSVFLEAMAQRGYTYASLASAAKVSTRTLGHIRSNRLVTRRTGYRVARALGGHGPEDFRIRTLVFSCPRTAV